MGIRFFGACGAPVVPRRVVSFQSVAIAALFAAALFLLPQIAQAQFVQQGDKLLGGGASGSAEQGTSVAVSADGNTALVGGPADSSGTGAVWVYTRDSSNGTWAQQGSKLVGNGLTLTANEGSSVALSADGNTAIFGGPLATPDPGFDNVGIGGVWVFTRDSNGTWTQQSSMLIGVGAMGVAAQGTSVALSADGNTAIAGGPADNFSFSFGPFGPIGDGAVWVYTRDGNGNWTQQGNKLVGSGASGAASQGRSVALSADGNTALVGGPTDSSGVGAVWVYTRSNGMWTQQGSKLVGSGNFGSSVALSADGNTAIVGGPDDSSGVGAVWVYTRSNGMWTQQGSKLIGSGASGAANQGSSVALSADGSIVVVGGPADDSNAGAAWVFVPAAIVASVSPNAGSVDGGALVGITGTRLTSTTGVTFGGVAATFVAVIDDTHVLAITPARAAGTVDVAVTTTSSGTATLAGAYTYDADPTTTLLLSSANPSALGQSVTFTAFVGASGTPNGSVTFKNGSATLGSVALSSGVATLTTSALGIGSHAITAVYGGQGDFDASVSAALTQTVGKAASTSTLTAAPNPATPGQTVKFTAAASAVAPAAGTPSGTVTFKQGATTLGSATLSAGKAIFDTSALTIGSHNVTASYGGNADWTASTSNMVTEVVSVRAGRPFQVNSFNGSKADVKQLPAVATLSGGSFVVVWESKGEDGSGYGIYGQMFKANGLKSGAEFKVNTTTSNDQTEPAVAAVSGGGFVVVWRSVETFWNVSAVAIFAQRYNKNGVRIGSEFKVNTTNANDELQPTVAGLADGGFVAAWTSNKQDGSGLGIYAQRYGKTGAKSGGEFRINTTTARSQQTPAVAALGTGFVVAWASNAHPSFGYDVYGQLFDNKSAKLGVEFLINTTRAKDQTQPAVAASASGFVVAWSSAGQDGSGLGVYAQRFDVSGAKLGGEFRVNTTTANDQSEPAVATFADGGFVVVWTSQGQDGSGNGVYGQGYDKSGNALNAEFLVNTTTAKDQWQPRAAALSANGFVVVWTAVDPTTSLQGIDAQRLSIGGL